MQDKLAYRYFAFISYSSKDNKAAAKVQRKIETYRLPTVLRNELEASTGKKYPPQVKPLFRDMTDLSAGLLGMSILRELEDSRFLLVICSPDSAKSEWVNQEVENFILIGRYERIIPYIIEGTPNSGDPETECFPPILRKKREFITYSHLSPEENAERQTKLHALLDGIHDELKGISLSGEGPRNSRLKVIARMLEVAPDTLIQRDKQQQKKRIIWSSITALFFLILFTSLGLWVWDRYFQVHVGYFADYVEYWGVPQGIFPLTPDQRKQRHDFYKIYTQNQQVIRLEHVNSADTPIPVDNSEFKDRPMIAVYPLYEKGRLVRRDDLDVNGKVIVSNHYSGNKMQKVEFKSVADDSTVSSTVLTNVTSLSKPLHNTNEGKHGEIGNMRFERDDIGRVIEVHFQKGGNDTPTTDEQGIAGFRYKLDELGRVIEKIYLGRDGKPCPDKQGVARRSNLYDGNGNLVEAKYFDANGNLTFNELGWMHCIDTYDNKGNCIDTKFIDVSGALCLNNDGVAGWKHKLDERGYIIEEAFFGVDDKPCLHKDGIAIITVKYNDRGRPTEIAYYGVDGKPCLIKDGFAKVAWKFDERGNAIEGSYFGIDGNPCLYKEGFSKVIIKYDERGNITEEAYFGADDKPCLHKDGNAKVTWKYDERGNITEEAYSGADDKPCLHKDGYAKITWEFDERGNIIESAYFGIDGQPCLSNKGYAKVSSKYDERGNSIEETYFGIDGQPCLNNNGYAKVAWKFDERGNLIDEIYFDTENKPCLQKAGFHRATGKFDERGRLIEATAFGIDGLPCLHEDGYSKLMLKYDERGNITEKAFFGIDGLPCLNDAAIAGFKSQYDEKNREIRREFFGTDGKPCVIGGDDPLTGWEKSYYDAGVIAKQTCFYTIKPFRKVLGKWIQEYDEQGNITKTSYLDMNDHPCLCEMGYSISIAKYNDQGNKIEEAFFDADGQPCQNNEGYAKAVRRYDKNGILMNITCFDIHGKEIPTYATAQRIMPDSNGEKFGIVKGDCFILYDGQPVENHYSFVEKRSKETGDDPHELVVLRDKEFVTIQIRPGLLGCILEPKIPTEEQQKLIAEKLKDAKKDSTPSQTD